MIKKIFLLVFIVFLSWALKAQNIENPIISNANSNVENKPATIKVYEYPSVMLTEDIISKQVEESRKNGVKEEELAMLNKLMHARMKKQLESLKDPNYVANLANRGSQQPLQVDATGCTNPGFENNSNSNWTFQSGDINGTNLPCNTCPGGTTAINVVTNATSTVAGQCTSGIDKYNNLITSVAPAPLGLTHSLLLNNANSGGKIMKASYSFVVNASSVVYTFQYAAVLNSGGHTTSQNPYFHVDVTDVTTHSVIPCTQYDATAPTSGNLPGWTKSALTGGSAPGAVYTKTWTTVNMDLSGVLNHTVTISYIVSDCNQGGHFGYAYIDATCEPAVITLTKALCAGSSAILTGPPGFATYTWAGPVTGTGQSLTTNQAGTYTLNTTSATGCPSPAITYILSSNPLPVPNFTTNSPACSGSIAFADGSTIAAPDNITNWVWNYGDGTAPVNATTAANQNHTYSTPGNYTVTLTDTTDNKCAATYSFVVSAGGGGPNPGFSSNSPAASPQCLAGNNVVFTNSSTTTGSVTITGYNWNYGDGSPIATSTTITPNTSHTYTTSGTYVVTLTVNVAGCSSTTTQTVVISPMPTAIISASKVCLGTSTVFTSTVTPTTGVTYSWNYGDGSPVSATSSHTYATASTFPVTLTVTTTPGGCTVTATTNATVTPLPTASFSVAQVCQGTGSVFVNTSSSDSACVWSFGGSGNPASAITNCNPTYTYSLSGTFPVTLTVTATGGCKATVTGTATVNPMPTLTFTANNPCEGTNVTFNNLTANQPSFSNWHWDFGDGGTDATATPPAHTYTTNCYPVILTATTTTGCTGAYTSTVYVHPNPGISFTAFEVCLGDSAEFVDSSYVINPPCLNDNITSWSWNFGDGTGAHVVTTMPDTLKYNYTACGPYNITLIVTTSNTCTNTATLTGDTVFCAPIVTGPVDFSVCPNQATPIQTFTTTCNNGGTPTTFWFQSLTNVDNTGAPASFINPGGIDQVPSYNAIAQNFSCNLLKDSVFAVAVSGFGCVGNAVYYVANVFPTPVLNHMDSIKVCANNQVIVPSFTACPTTSTIAWTNTTTSIGLAASGNGNIPSPFTGLNTTPQALYALITATPSANTCVGPDSTFIIAVSPLPTITVTPQGPYCPGDNVSSPVINMPNNTILTWTVSNAANIGMTTPGVGIPAPHTAPANASLVNQVGVISYTPTLNGCVGTPTVGTITIKPTPVIQPIANVAYCPGAAVPQITYACLPTGMGTPNFNWQISTTPFNVGVNPATASGDSLPAFTAAANNTGVAQMATVTLGASLNNCPSSFSNFIVTINPTPTASFSSIPVCEGKVMNFTDLSTPNSGAITVNQWAWDMNNDGIYNDATTQNPQYSVTPAGQDPITLFVSTNSVPSCTAVVTQTVTVYPNPVPDFVADTLSGCPILPVTFRDTSSVAAPSTITSYSWNFGNGNSSSVKDPTDIQNYNNASATAIKSYTISLTVTSTGGCTATKTKAHYINVSPRPIADFSWGPTDVDIDDPAIIFVNQAIGAGPYVPVTYGQYGVHYYLGDIHAYNPNSNYVDNNTSFSHVYEYYQPETYSVTQWVINNLGCKDSITKEVIIQPNFTFYIPNAFSPNGDGTNEGFKGTGVGIKEGTYNLWVFDRWGNMLFYSDDLEKAWDGHLKGNEDRPILQEDVYVWKVNFHDFTGKKHDFHGTVTLIK